MPLLTAHEVCLLLSASLAGRCLIRCLASAGAALLAATVYLVHCRPGPCLGFILRQASFLVAFFNVFSLPFLLSV